MGCYVNRVGMACRGTRQETRRPEWSLTKQFRSQMKKRSKRREKNLNTGDMTEIYSDCSDVEVKEEKE